MVLKSLRLINFGGYHDTLLTFDAEKQPVSMFYGPNGCGKSSILEAVRLVSNPLVFKDRAQGAEAYLRPWIYDSDYQSGSDRVKGAKNEMYIHSIFSDNGEEKNVVIGNAGFMLNEIGEQHLGFSFYVDADNPINWAKFQLHSADAGKFIELAEAIYGFECDLDCEVKDKIQETDGTWTEHLYYQDVVIKKGRDRVHFCRMSAGEKKIATLIRQLCNPDSLINRNIVLIDNVDLHVYFARHAKMIDRLVKHFEGKQFFLTSHSHDMIQHVGELYGKQCLYDMQKIKNIAFRDE